jgi:YD repeat-containing protein
VEIGDDTQFFYDGRGNRLIATRAGIATRYIYDPWGNLIAEADGSNNITRKYIYGKGLLAMAASSTRYCNHFDGTGSTVAITDMTGNVVNRQHHARSCSSPVELNFCPTSPSLIICL